MLQMHMTLNSSAVNDVGLKMQCTSEDKAASSIVLLTASRYCQQSLALVLSTQCGSSVPCTFGGQSSMHKADTVDHHAQDWGKQPGGD